MEPGLLRSVCVCLLEIVRGRRDRDGRGEGKGREMGVEGGRKPEPFF